MQDWVTTFEYSRKWNHKNFNACHEQQNIEE